MKKNALTVVLLSLLVSLPCFAFTNYGPFYVDDDSGVDTATGTFNAPFRTIQKAVDRISSGVNVTSATCFVFPGLYAEEVLISTNGNSPKMMVITPLSNIAPIITGLSNGIHIWHCNDVMIRGMRIKGMNWSCILTEGIDTASRVSNIILKQNVCYSNRNRSTVLVLNANNVRILSNIITDSPVGIDLNQNVARCLIEGNKLGHHLSQSIDLYNECNTNVIRFNLIMSNQQHGIIFYNGKDQLVYRNRFVNMGLDAIWVAPGATGTINILNNSFYSNANMAESQIKVEAATVRVHNNIIANSGRFGINHLGGTVIASYNDVYGNASGNYQGCAGGNGSISLDPSWFVNYSSIDDFLSLSNKSFCIDVGTNLGFPFNGSAPDLGWKESGPSIIMTISKSVSNVSLRNSPLAFALPGSTLQIKITYSIITNLMRASNVVLYDKIATNTVFLTQYLQTATGWTCKYSTNLNPVQGYYSLSYSTIMPAKPKIKWVRWHKKYASAENSKAIIEKVVVK